MKLKIVFAISFIAFFAVSANAQVKYPSILWEIKKTPTSKPSYLFGTYHIASKGVFKLGDSLFYALKNVDIVAKELNANNWQAEQNTMDEMQMAYAIYYNNLKQSTFTENTLKVTNTIEKIPAFISLQPTFVNYFLSRADATKDGFEEEMFLDKFLSSAGYKYGKEIKGLENYMESNVLSLQGQRDQADLEKQETQKIPGDISYQEMNDKIYDGYLNNNLDAMDLYAKYQYESEIYYRKFITIRNYNQADSMDYYMKTGKTLFAAIGASHLPGNEGVIELLRKKGYKVRPVTLKNNNNTELEKIKKTTIPLKNYPQNIDDIIKVNAPGKFFAYEKTDVLKSYGYIDMTNSAFFYVSRLFNNASYFNYSSKKITTAFDSLLFSNIKGDIVEKNQKIIDGYHCVNVTTKVKNKDIERYRFVITPYEIIKFQVGGKNEYASLPFIDEFFNSIKIEASQKLSDNYSFNFKGNNTYHVWNTNNYQFTQNKLHFSNYDSANSQHNICIKVLLPNGKKATDSLVSHLIRESFLSSEAFSSDFLNDLSKFPIANNEIKTLALKNGSFLSTKYIIKLPYIYLLNSIKSTTPSPEFINSFYLKDYKIAKTYDFADTANEYSIKLPYALNFDEKWKFEADRRKKEYDETLKPNANENLFYRPTTFGENSTISNIAFEDAQNIESIKLDINTFNENSSYANSSLFWKEILEKHTTDFSSRRYNSKYDYIEENDFLAKKPFELNSKNELKQFYFDDKNIEKIKYDTANKKLQTVDFYTNDSITNLKTFHKYTLTNNKLYHIYFVQFDTTQTAFQNLITQNFKPFTQKKLIHIYNSPLIKIINEYSTATVQKRPLVLKKLNNINLGLSDLRIVDSVFNKNKNNDIAKNILRRKLIDMVANGSYSDDEWKNVSTWLKSIYNNENELVTLRTFALNAILDEQNYHDADWLIENIYYKAGVFQKNVSSDLVDYMLYITPKKDLLNKVKLTLKDKDDDKYFCLIDSGYFNLAEKKEAFAFYKKQLEDETLNIKLSEEENNFIFKESEINETLTNNQDYNIFGQLVSGFRYFYETNQADPFFDDAINKIINANSNKDMLALLNIFLKQKEPNYKHIDKVVAQLGKEQSNYLELNKIFFENKKLDKLSNIYKDKKQLAKYFLLSKSTYEKLDSVTFIGAQKYIYAKNDSIYFFKYINEKEKNASIAYVVLDSDNNFLSEDPYYSFTSEQINKTETFAKISKKLISRLYTSTYFTDYSNFYNLNNFSKSLSSEE